MGQKNYLAIDVGASKTLMAAFSEDGQVLTTHKFKTPADYRQLLAAIKQALDAELANFSFTQACVAVPGWLDFSKDIVLAFGNLPWHNVPVKADVGQLLPNASVLVHNDAKLAGLSEAILLHKKYRKVLYLTISTGIGGGVIIDEMIDPDFANFEPGHMVIEHDGQAQKWEAFASGSALFKRYGQLASEIDDPAIWQQFAQAVSTGLQELLATVQPQVVIVGGGAGAHFEKFEPYLIDDLKSVNDPLVPVPPIVKARRPEEAVIYGCYEYIKQNA